MEFLLAEPSSNLYSTYWLQNTQLNRHLTTFDGRVILAYLKVTRMMNLAGLVDPEMELNIFVGQNFADVPNETEIQDQAFQQALKRLYDKY